MGDYTPSPRIMKLVPEIKKLYLEDGLSIREVANKVGLYSGTVSKVINIYLKCGRNKSDNHKLVFKRLSDKQKNALIVGRKAIIDDHNYIQKLSDTKKGTLNPGHKLKESDVIEIRKLYKDYLNKGYKKTETQHLLAERFSVKRPTISDVVLHKTWKHLK